LSKKLKSQILNKKLTLAGFFLHLGIIAGIIDSCWALRDYLEAVNIPIASLSFLTTSATSMYSGKFNSTGVRHLFHHHDRLTCRMK